MSERLAALSRRAFFGRFANRGEEQSPSSTDIAIERAGEALSLFVVLYLAYKGSFDHSVTYQVKSESEAKNAPEFVKSVDQLGRLHTLCDGTQKQADRMYTAWENAFLETEYYWDTEISYDSKGNPHTESVLKSRQVFREPWELTSRGINERKLKDWQGFFGRLSQKASDAKSGLSQAFNLEEDRQESIYYSEKAADGVGQFLWAIPLYAAVGGSFCLYEEVASRASGGENRLFNDKLYLKRRTLVKLLATGIGALGIRNLQLAFAKKNHDLLDDVKKHTKGVLRVMEVGDAANFQRFFEKDPLIIRDTLVEMRDKSNAALRSGYRGSNWSIVEPQLRATLAWSSKVLADFDGLFSFDPVTNTLVVPKELTQITKYLWATRQIVDYANSKSFETYGRHLVDAAILGAGFAATAGVGEYLFPLLDKVSQSFHETDQEELN